MITLSLNRRRITAISDSIRISTGWPLSEPRILSCWIALDDATVENGCMHVVPGSHRDQRFSPEAKQRELEALRKIRQ